MWTFISFEMNVRYLWQMVTQNSTCVYLQQMLLNFTSFKYIEPHAKYHMHFTVALGPLAVLCFFGKEV